LREHLEQRLKELKAEYETGQARLRELETEQTYVRETLLRISGAIQVLEETLAAERTPGETPPTDSLEPEPVSEAVE
jgi:predicted nuclease with TOPRIM domain